MTIEIIIPAYNCRKTLHRTLSSLEAQTDSDFLVHIIDDHSTEDLADILTIHKDLNLRVTRNKTNQGCGMSRQVGIDSTEADYIAFLDSDDVLMPYAVEVWKNSVLSAPDVDVFNNYFMEQTPVGLLLRKDGHVWCHGKLYKVSFIRKWGIRNSPEVKYADDSYFNSICTELGVYAEIPMPLYLWMDNQDSITRNPESLFHKDYIRDFIHAMRLSAQFVRSKGVARPKHIDNTIANIERLIIADDECAISEYQLLLKEIAE